jgi:hypothetical protein
MIDGNTNSVSMTTYSYQPMTLGSADPSAPPAPVAFGYSVVSADNIMPFEVSSQTDHRDYYNQPNYASSNYPSASYPPTTSRSPTYPSPFASKPYPSALPSANSNVLDSPALPLQDFYYVKLLSVIVSVLSVVAILLVIIMLSALEFLVLLLWWHISCFNPLF